MALEGPRGSAAPSELALGIGARGRPWPAATRRRCLRSSVALPSRWRVLGLRSRTQRARCPWYSQHPNHPATGLSHDKEAARASIVYTHADHDCVSPHVRASVAVYAAFGDENRCRESRPDLLARAPARAALQQLYSGAPTVVKFQRESVQCMVLVSFSFSLYSCHIMKRVPGISSNPAAS